MDVIELNEAFAAQALAVTRDLGLPDDAAHVNPNGGAIAIGHPLGASGARLVTTALNQLERIGGPLRAVHDVHRRGAGHRARHRARLAHSAPIGCCARRACLGAGDRARYRAGLTPSRSALRATLKRFTA